MSRQFNEVQLYLPEFWWWEPYFEDGWGVMWMRIERHPEYYISHDGYVLSAVNPESPRILSTWENTHGHQYVQMDGEKILVHRLVAEAFNHNIHNYPIVRHLDDDPRNNHYRNLEWGTPKDNIADMFRNGNDFHIPVYCYETDTVYRSGAIAAKELGVSRASVCYCCKGKTPSVKGYHFCYPEEKHEFIKQKRHKATWSHNYKPVVAIYPNGKERKFKSRKEAAEKLNIPDCGISSVLTGHLEHTHGYKFKEVEHAN